MIELRHHFETRVYETQARRVRWANVVFYRRALHEAIIPVRIRPIPQAILPMNSGALGSPSVRAIFDPSQLSHKRN
jgi:hypothetical protein